MKRSPLPAVIHDLPRPALGILLCAMLGMASGRLLGQGQEPAAKQSREAAGAGAPLGEQDEPQASSQDGRPDFEAIKRSGAQRSRYRAAPSEDEAALEDAKPEADLATFRERVSPILERNCLRCHGPRRQKGGVQIDDLDPDLFQGEDVEWWLEVLAVVTNGEMPPADEVTMDDVDRGVLIDWLSREVQGASAARRSEHGHSSFRRMTRYEYDYALQDLLLLPEGYTADLLPDPVSEDGFQNSSEALHISAMQLQSYLDAGRKALRSAIAVGERPPTLYWEIPMSAPAGVEWKRQDDHLAKLRKDHADKPEELEKKLVEQEKRYAKRPGGAHFEQRSSGRLARQPWHYSQGKFAWEPSLEPGPLATNEGPADEVAVVPAGQGLIVELGDRLPLEGVLRVTVLASKARSEGDRDPSLQLDFGWQASNDSRAVYRVSREDRRVTAGPDAPQAYSWDLPMGPVYPRNGVRGTNKMGDLPSPSEYLKLVNSSLSKEALQIHWVHVAGPVYDQWPPRSHVQLLGVRRADQNDVEQAREVLARFLPQAFRRPARDGEIERKLALFERLRPEFESFEETMVEVLATLLASPNFLYLATANPLGETELAEPTGPTASPSGAAAPGPLALDGPELATRLAMFLWSSVPDGELAAVAQAGQLHKPAVLESQVKRLLADPRSGRFANQFVRQWLDLDLLDYLQVDRKAYPGFRATLKEAMAQEPVAFFQEAMDQDLGVLEFLHSDFTMANERLARHYGIKGVEGNHFRRVELGAEARRGGLLAQAGLLAMNSDGTDSHPLKRGIWMLERLLNDPPPPPPPAVPEIDLTDPKIAEMTLKERIEQHRDHAACMSCHAKIDPWGIAFENFDAVGRWRVEVGGKPVDAVGELFNGQELDGMDGLKGFLLENRQDQFVRALVHKLCTYALGRPLSFQDRAAIDGIAAQVRRRGDGLATMVQQIVASELFLSR